ncbi:hypothetical protein BH18ACT4_BH18ACT4_00270 [soil metagenome]
MDETDRTDAALGELYDAATVARLDRRSQPLIRGPEATSESGWRRGGAAGALIAGLVLGLRDALEPSGDKPIIEELDLSELDDSKRPVVFHYVSGDPPASVVIVRPWLLAPR